MYLGKERRNRVVALVLAAVLVASVVLALIATAASGAPTSGTGPLSALLPAHARLVSITPADGARLDTSPRQITLTFDEPMPLELAQVILTRDGGPVELGAPTARDAGVTVPVTGQLRPGSYRIVWRATSDDGHPISGESTFTVTGDAPGQGGVAVPLATPSYKTPQTQATTIGHPDHAPGLIVGAVLLLGGVVLLVHEQRRRRAHRDEPIT